jgi:hypothetical protein
MLGYLPVQPSSDPIAGTGCIHVHPSVRDLGERLTFDSRSRQELLLRALKDHDALKMDAKQIAEAVSGVAFTASAPEHLTLELVSVDGRIIEASVGPFVFSLRLQKFERETQAGHLGIATIIQWSVRVYHQLLQLGLLSRSSSVSTRLLAKQFLNMRVPHD